MIFKLWFNNLEKANANTSNFSTWAYLFLSPFILNIMLKISARYFMSARNKFKFTSYIETLQALANVFFQQKNKLILFPLSAIQNYIMTKMCVMGYQSSRCWVSSRFLFVFSVFRSFLIFFNIKRVQHGKRETWK